MPHRGHKFDPAHRDVLDAPERREYLSPETILPRFGVKPGWTVVDIGAGTGFNTFPLSDLVGSRGRVYAAEVQKAMLSVLREKLAQTPRANVTVLESEEDRIPIDAHTADFVLLACVLHELEGPGTLREAARILKPTGILGIVDWKRMRQDIGPPLAHRLSERQAIARVVKQGFRSDPPFEAGAHHYGFAARIRT